MDRRTDMQILAANELFAGAGEAIAAAYDAFAGQTFAAGETLFEHGMPATRLFAVFGGRVRLTHCAHGLQVHDNVSDGDRDHGFLLNYANYSEVTGNSVADGGEKCVFIYNANFNERRRDSFAECEIGIHFTPAPRTTRMRQRLPRQSEPSQVFRDRARGLVRRRAGQLLER